MTNEEMMKIIDRKLKQLDEIEEKCDKLEKACNTHQLYRWYPIDEYMRIHPDYVKRGDERSKRVFVTSSFKQIDILLRLVDIYRGDNDEEGADNKAESVL